MTIISDEVRAAYREKLLLLWLWRTRITYTDNFSFEYCSGGGRKKDVFCAKALHERRVQLHATK